MRQRTREATTWSLVVIPLLSVVRGAKVGAGVSHCTSVPFLGQVDCLPAASQEKVFYADEAGCTPINADGMRLNGQSGLSSAACAGPRTGNPALSACILLHLRKNLLAESARTCGASPRWRPHPIAMSRRWLPSKVAPPSDGSRRAGDARGFAPVPLGATKARERRGSEPRRVGVRPAKVHLGSSVHRVPSRPR